MSPHRASLDERISWTTDFTRATDKAVLQALAFWADYETGANAYPSVEKLAARANMAKRTVERSLHRLIAEGRITARRRHRGATIYGIVLERLAVSRADARAVPPTKRDRLSATMADKTPDLLSANMAGLSAKSGDLVRHSGGPTRDQYPCTSTQVHRRVAPASEIATSETTTAAGGGVFAEGDFYGMAATEGAQLAAGAGDVSADSRDRAVVGSDGADRGSTELGRMDQTAARDAGIQLQQRPDPPGDRHADRSGAPFQQSIMLPIDGDDFAPIVADDQPRQVSRLVTLGDVWRANLAARKKAASS